MADVICCSIESEPRTLSEKQLNQAREVAADVVQKLETKEASLLFTTGLEPVEKQMDKNIEEGRSEEESGECKEKGDQVVVGSHCQCLCCSNKNLGSPEPVVCREPLSAPF